MARVHITGAQPYLISAAFDIGTSSSCYAFCFRTNIQDVINIFMNKNWGQGVRTVVNTYLTLNATGNNKYTTRWG